MLSGEDGAEGDVAQVDTKLFGWRILVIPKSSPNWDGAVERAHGVIDQEYYLNPTRPWQTLQEYLHFYNHEWIRLDKYLNGLTPVEKWQQYLLTVSLSKVNQRNLQ